MAGSLHFPVDYRKMQRKSQITDHRSPITDHDFFVIYFCVGVVPFFSIILVSAFSGGLPENAEIPPQTTGKCKDPATGPGLESICAARSVLCRSFAATQTSRGLELSIVPVKPHERGDGTRRRQSNSVNVSCWDALCRDAQSFWRGEPGRPPRRLQRRSCGNICFR